MLVQRKIPFGLGMGRQRRILALFAHQWSCEARREATHKLAEGVSVVHKCRFGRVTNALKWIAGLLPNGRAPFY